MLKHMSQVQQYYLKDFSTVSHILAILELTLNRNMVHSGVLPIALYICMYLLNNAQEILVIIDLSQYLMTVSMWAYRTQIMDDYRPCFPLQQRRQQPNCVVELPSLCFSFLCGSVCSDNDEFIPSLSKWTESMRKMRLLGCSKQPGNICFNNVQRKTILLASIIGIQLGF